MVRVSKGWLRLGHRVRRRHVAVVVVDVVVGFHGVMGRRMFYYAHISIHLWKKRFRLL